MKTYIVFDLEWNQSPDGRQGTVEAFPFEILEIGAVKLDGEFRITDQFSRFIRPQVYRKLHHMISEVTHMSIEELNAEGVAFPEAAREFLAWCGPEAVFCTWGSMDLLELQRNMRYYGMEAPFQKPLLYYDIQKLYGLFFKDGEKPSLDAAVEEQGLPMERPFHRALDDSYYTGLVLERMAGVLGADTFLPYVSVDYYRLPESKAEEIRLTFPDYFKYVSRVFASKEDAMADRNVTEIKCGQCGRTLRKKIRWFAQSQKMYFALAACPEHGYVKGRIRIKKADGDRVFVVKTLKHTDEEGAAQIRARKEEVKKKRAKRNREKRKRQREEAMAAAAGGVKNTAVGVQNALAGGGKHRRRRRRKRKEGS